MLKRDNERIKSIETLLIAQEGIKAELNKHSQLLSEHEQRLEADKERGDLMLKANMAILDGMLSEDDKESLKATRKEIQDFLVEKN